MKRTILAIAFCLVISEMFAENIFTSKEKLCIDETSLTWENLSDRIIEDEDNGKVYIAFQDTQTELILQADIKAYSSETGVMVRRNKLNSLLSADKPIFIKGYTEDNIQYIIPKNECGEMVAKDGPIMSLSKIKIAKSDLPVVLTFGGKKISLVSFDKNDKDACAVIRKYALGFTSPTTIKDTMQSEDLSTITFDKISINSSNKYWSIKEEYFVNGQLVSTKGDNIIIPNELFDDIKTNGSLTVTYNIHLTNDYFGHDFSGSIAEITIEQSFFGEKLLSFIPTALSSIGVIVGIFAVILLVMGIYWWFTKSTPIKTRGHKTLRLLIGPSGEITHGNKALMTGTFESLDGYIYKLKRQKWYSIFSHICFIGVKIECTGNNSFILDISCEAGDNVGQIHYNNGITDRIITVGMKAYDDGVFVLDDKSEIIIEGGKIHEVKKHIISIRNTSHYITLNAEEPQVNDFVTPKNNKKQYSIDTLDGIRFDIFNNRIQRISNLTNTTTNQIELVATNGKTIIVIPNGNVPAVGDIAKVADGKYIVENVVYVIEGGKINSITSHKEEQYTQSELIEIVKQLREENHKLQSRPTQESFELLKDQNEKVKADLVDLKKKYENVDKAIETAKSEAKIEEKKRLDSIYKKDIIDNYISIIEHKQKLNKAEKLTKEAVDAKENSEKALKLKETELNAATDKISGLNKVVLDKETEIITQKATIAKFKEVALKKNVHFVYQVQETLEEISNTFKDVYKDMTNSTIKEGFISPMLKGVSGLGAGILSWAEDYTVKVKGDSEGFFGGDFMSMKEEDVKEIISKKFISNIVKSDSFSKFVRLYQLSSVPFIRKQLVEAGMNIDVLNKLYYKVYTLVSDFDYQIICPKLFEEQHSDKKYQWFNSTNLFNIINLPEEEKKAIKELGPETIIDVNQIGFISPWASRNATAVTPDF